jgi:hypothetical protein
MLRMRSKKPATRAEQQKPESEAARLLGQRSAAARRKQWGNEAFVRKMREWGKLGGRPRKVNNVRKEKA